MRACSTILLLCLNALAGAVGEDLSAEPLPQAAPEKGAVKVTLDASASFDPDGDKLAFEWRQVSGPPVVLYDATTAKPFFFTARPGIYSFTARAFDGELFSAPITVTRTIKGANAKPVAVPGKDRKVRLGATLLLDARGSRDPEGAVLKYDWQDLSGPAPLIGATGSTKPVLRLKPTRQGAYIVRLKVFDGELWSDPQELKIEVLAPNREPVAKADESDEILLPDSRNRPPVACTLPGSTIRLGDWAVLDGSASYDLDADAVAHFWYQDAGPPVRELRQVRGMATVRFRPEEPGLYRFRLIVSDGKADSDPAYVEIKVIDDRPAPQVVLPEEVTGTVGARTVLDGSASRGVDQPLSGKWTQLSGPQVRNFFVDAAHSGLVTAFIPEQAGEYVFCLTVTDASGRSSSRSVKVAVEPANQPPAVEAPSAIAASDGKAVIPIRTVDPDGDNVEVAVKVLEGRMTVLETGPDRIVLENIASSGTLRLYFRDGRGGVASRDVAVEAGSAVPLHVAIRGQRRVKVGQRLLLDAVAAAGLTPLAFQWQVEGTGLYLPPRAAAESRILLYPDKPGIYTFRVTVSCGRLQGSAEAVVEVAEKGAGTGTSALRPESMDGALKMLGSGDDEAKDAAAQFLIEKGREALPALTTALTSPNHDLRREAAALIEYITGQPVANSIAAPSPVEE